VFAWAAAREEINVEAWKVHKFGGSSVADAACMERVARIIEGDPAMRKAVVLSACRGVTDALLTLIALAEKQDPSLDERIQELRHRRRHRGELLDGDLYDDFVVNSTTTAATSPASCRRCGWCAPPRPPCAT
jgi:aspartokinase